MNIFLISMLITCCMVFAAFGGDRLQKPGEIESQDKNEKIETFETIEFRQVDGTSLQIGAVRIGSIYYTETRDGYTIVLNDSGYYEYAKLDEEGALIPSGVKANDPINRDDDEVKYLNHKEKHLRYQSPKLDELENKDQYRFHERSN